MHDDAARADRGGGAQGRHEQRRGLGGPAQINRVRRVHVEAGADRGDGGGRRRQLGVGEAEAAAAGAAQEDLEGRPAQVLVGRQDCLGQRAPAPHVAPHVELGKIK